LPGDGVRLFSSIADKRGVVGLLLLLHTLFTPDLIMCDLLLARAASPGAVMNQ